MAVPERLTIRSLYLYLVCLVTLVISIFAAVSLLRGTVELLYPDPGFYGFIEGPEGQRLSEEETARQQQLAEDSQRRQAVLGMVGAGTTLLIAGPLYIYHWRRVQTELSPRSPQPAESGAAP